MAFMMHVHIWWSYTIIGVHITRVHNNAQSHYGGTGLETESRERINPVYFGGAHPCSALWYAAWNER